METETTAAATKRIFLIINCILLAVGNCGGPLIMRLYFIRGGKRIWFSSWLETGGWPIILIPLLVSYTRRRTSAGPKLSHIKLLDDYLYAYGVSKLPVSHHAPRGDAAGVHGGVRISDREQKFTAYSVNAVVLLTVGSVVLGVHTSSDRPEGESNKEYWLGFFMTLSAAALYGLILPLVELTYKTAEQAITYTLVMEIQLVMCFFATLFCTIGMIINNDFQAISRETKEYELGEAKYYLVVVWSGIIWQCFYLGAIGVIFYSSSLLSAIIIHVLFPVTQTLAIIFYHETFHAEKGVAFFLAIWGFTSYFFS